ncbi:MAG: DNA methyltransferase [Bacteroidetes bacterium]|nr:DNA methyltransferase [Bacteroidota bacterium]
MNSGSVHLIATDPPFNKGKDFHATPDSLAAGAKFQHRWSWERDVHGDWVDQTQDDYPKVWSVIQSSRLTYGDDMGAFLCFMAVRLLEMQRILRSDGRIYLHCDPTASHYLKQLMGGVFGKKTSLMR